jgi:hypothetical protein
MRYIFSDKSSACAERLVTDRDLREEVEFARKNSEPKLRVFSTDAAITDRQHFSLLRQLNERMRAFWEKSAEGGRL